MKPFHIFFFFVLLSNCRPTDPNPKGTENNPVRTYDDFVAVADREGLPLSSFGVKRSWSEVVAIAGAYGLADSIRNNEERHTTLIFKEEAEVRAYLERLKETYESRRQLDAYTERRKKIQCVDEYFEILKDFPLASKMVFPTEEALNERKKEMYSPDIDVYVNEAPRKGETKIYPSTMSMPKGQKPEDKARLLPKHCNGTAASSLNK